jgi:hypothetical protein
VRGKGSSRCGWLAISAFIILPLCAADVTVRGRVVDENDAPVRGARVTVKTWEALTDPTGAFSLTLPGSGDFLVNVACAGYYALKDRAVHIESSHELTLVIASVREVFQSENVNAETSPVDVGQAQSQQRLSGTEVNDMPFGNSHSLRSSLQLVPGMIEDAAGTLHLNGSSENQVNYSLNGFDITSPISGKFQTLLAPEGIRSVDISSGRTSPEFGKGSAGVLAVNTENGTDTFHYTATNFIPGFDVKQGVRLGNWYPRFGVSGPIVRGRAWFSDTFISQYSQSVVAGLPRSENTRGGWAGSNLVHTQWNLRPSNILFADFLVNVDNQTRLGLAPLNPVSTTSSLHSHEYLFGFRDQQYFGHGALIEIGYAHSDFYAAQSPQGQGLFIISPQGNSGNYFLNSTQTASRDQGLLQGFLPKFQWAGAHQIQVGADSSWLHYTADNSRTGYQVMSLSGQLISQTLFPNPARFRVEDLAMAFYALDTWRVSKRLQFNLGVRQDWDQKIDATAWSPRLAFSWAPFESARTRISGGYSITHDAITMDMLGRPFDQTAVTTLYNPLRASTLTRFTVPHRGLTLPRASNWTLDIDHQLRANLYVSAKYLRRRGKDEFAFLNTLAPNGPPSLLPLPDVSSGGIYQLANLRRDDFDSYSVSIRQNLSAQYEWMAAYTRSRAVSNAVLDPNTDQPLQVLPAFVPMPWNAPNRVLAWGYLPLPWKNWAVSVLADMRSGFPFSVRDQTGLVVGAVDSYRFPINFDLNLAIERMVTLRGYRFALRGGVDNLTDQANPTAVNNVIGAPQYLQFLGKEGRHFVVRIRFFGRAVK